MNDTDIATLSLLRGRINAFDADCTTIGETDTGDAWALLNDIEDALADIVKRHAAPESTDRSDSPAYDAQGRRLSPHGAVLPKWYPDLATRVQRHGARHD